VLLVNKKGNILGLGMNLCSFTGFLADDPILKTVNGVSVLNFTLVTYSYRRAKSTGEKSRMPAFLRCEAWHTGAETISKFAKKGSKISIFASARNASKEDRQIVFRVNEFDFATTEDSDPVSGEKYA
jgi:single-stranded DNA-binding protein